MLLLLGDPLLQVTHRVVLSDAPGHGCEHPERGADERAAPLLFLLRNPGAFEFLAHLGHVGLPGDVARDADPTRLGGLIARPFGTAKYQSKAFPQLD